MEALTTFDAFKQEIAEAKDCKELIQVMNKFEDALDTEGHGVTQFEESLLRYGIARRAEDIKQERGLN